jgi:hypothetical protein
MNPNEANAKRSTTSTAEMSENDKRNLASFSEERKSSSARPVSPGQEKARLASTSPNEGQARTPTFFAKRASRAPTVIPRSSAITRMDLVGSAERIFLRYLSPSSNTVNSSENHEIYLPPALRIHNFPLNISQEPKTPNELSQMAQIPDMFHAQKEYCYKAMEQDAFPRFLRSKAFGNLTPVSALVRLVIGLVTLWVGLATGFSLIFLDVQPRSKRFFVSFRCCISLIQMLTRHSYSSHSP